MFFLKRNSLVIAFAWLIVTIVLSLYISTANSYTHNIFVALNLISYFLCLYNWVSSGCRIISIYVVFVAYCMMSNLGQCILYFFLVPEELIPLYYLVDFDTLVKLLRFEVTCIAGLNLGTVLYVRKARRCISLEKQQYCKIGKIQSESLLTYLLYICLGYYFFSISKLIILRQSLTYEQLFDAARDSGLVFSFIKLGYLLLSIYFLFHKRHVKLIIGSALYVAFGYMFAGSKGLALQSICVLLTAVPVIKPNLFVRKYMKYWFVGAFLFFASLSFFTSLRSQNIATASFQGSVFSSFVGTISEMGYSTRAATLVIERVDQGIPHYQTILFTIVRAFIPFSSNISVIEEADFNLSNWITEYAGNDIENGIGFSCIGELYINYGWYAFVFMIFWGYFISYAENYAYKLIIKDRYLYSLLLLAVACTLVPWARDEFHRVQEVLRIGLYLVIIYWLVIKRHSII